MKSNLCRFIKAFAEELENEWDQEINDDISGGNITIITGDYTQQIHEDLFEYHKKAGNEPVDALFCAPPNYTTSLPTITTKLTDWGYEVWDGTSKKVRETFPESHKEHRVVKYESCRGLEGWTVVCLALDKFYEHRLRNVPKNKELSLFDEHETFAKRHAAAWTLIPLTRAIDHLVIQIEEKSLIMEICQRLQKRFPDFVTFRK